MHYRGVECYNEAGQAKCGVCPPGHVGDGLTCTLASDPCSASPCFEGVTCVNLWAGRSAGFVCGECPDTLGNKSTKKS